MKCRGPKTLKIQQQSNGFTLLELTIVITILGILMSIGTVVAIGSMSRARDSERKSDAETIALHLENFYKYGTDDVDGVELYNTAGGQYPFAGTSGGNLIDNVRDILRDIDPKSLECPGETSSSLESAENGSPLVEDSMNFNNYVYQPLDADNNLCIAKTQDCRKFNLYYRLENKSKDTVNCDNVTFICKIESKNQ